MSICTLQKFLHKNLHLQRTGGSVFHRDTHTVILTDHSVWRSEDSKLIETRFPNVDVSIMASEASLSGFVVVFTCDLARNNVWQRSTIGLLLHVACFLASLFSTLSLLP